MLVTSAVVSCKWSVATAGYQWRQARRVSDAWTVELESQSVLVPTGFPFHQELMKYEPLDSSGLFYELAAIEPTTEGIQVFANRLGALTHGRLFVPEGREIDVPTPDTNIRLSHHYEDRLIGWETEARKVAKRWVMQGAVMGDSLSDWQEEIRVLRAMVSLWEALRNANRKAVEKFVQFDWRGNRRTIKIIDEKGKIVAPVMIFELGISANLKLMSAAEHGLTKALSDLTSNTSGILLFPHESKYRQKLAIVPKSLRDAIWLQFALAVLENKKYRACEVCGKSFEVSPQVARTTRTLCSPACKQKAHRLRRDHCLKLAEQGLTAEQIAKNVGSQLSTVKNWLQERKEKQ